MGQNIFQIGEELQNVISEIEDNGGEITEELENKLVITEENFKNKIDSYCNAIRFYESNNKCCTEEKSRINDIQNTRKNIIERLKNNLLQAVLLYGTEGKSGNKTAETIYHKLFTKKKEDIVARDVRIKDFGTRLINYLIELHQNGCLVVGEEIDLPSIINLLNNAITIENDFDGNSPVEEFEPYTVEDLDCTNVEITFKLTLSDLFKCNPELATILCTGQNVEDVKFTLNKDNAKYYGKDTTLAETRITQSITIK